MLSLYLHRDSWIHQLAAGPKIFLSFLGGGIILFVNDSMALAALLLLTCGLYLAAKLPLSALFSAVKPILIMLLFIFLFQYFISGLSEAARMLLRVSTVLLLTSLVTLTTRLTDMIDTLTRLARPLSRLGMTPSRIALAVSLTIRFIPALLKDLAEIQMARLARRARGPALFAAGPLIVKILRMTDVLGDAIVARCFENRKSP